MEQLNGIIRNNEYIFWYDVSVVDNYIFEFIREKFPNSIILPEFDQIDWFIIDENLPIEIQSTITHTRANSKRDATPLHSEFENKIRKQLEQNIIAYNKCWFFFDADYLKYLQKGLTKSSSINMDWFYKFLKEEKLKVFTCSYDGIIEEKYCNDFEFIRKFSNTCQLGKNQDSRILQQNKPKITKIMFDYYGVDTYDIRLARAKFLDRDIKNKRMDFRCWLFREEMNNKEKTIGKIYWALASLEIANSGFDCNVIAQRGNINRLETIFNYLGFIETVYGNNQNTIRRYVDKYSISQYFPGYLRKKEKWDYLKESKMKLNNNQLYAIFTGRINPLDWKNVANAGW